MNDAKAEFPRITYCKDPYAAVREAHAVAIVTEWNQLRNLDLDKMRKSMKGKLFFDLRNIYNPARMAKTGFHYYSTGRPGLEKK